jgi:hypothetical protein
MFSLVNFIVVVLFNLYLIFLDFELYISIYKFEHWKNNWYTSALTWLYAFWGISNLVWYLNH